MSRYEEIIRVQNSVSEGKWEKEEKDTKKEAE
jgi:hypothetical protein